ncbi:uncharacterized protein LOC126908715 isoform X2 [Daktulosphaira vitifoliae]|uniref:uncharacterized protein LOC126908715 isoform X2 n=1 Tax=Daktulosphaira vitifoliae TaxID=58002 RepID=UPI0021A97F7D|nr:uncharacterized protein LOC126908715 isoform X2 [Daktulosphaira vitifoliae]
MSRHHCAATPLCGVFLFMVSRKKQTVNAYVAHFFLKYLKMFNISIVIFYFLFCYINSEVCPICLDEFSLESYFLKFCRHLYCKVCLDQWLQTNSTCPKCRCPIDENNGKLLLIKKNLSYCEIKYGQDGCIVLSNGPDCSSSEEDIESEDDDASFSIDLPSNDDEKKSTVIIKRIYLNYPIRRMCVNRIIQKF